MNLQRLSRAGENLTASKPTCEGKEMSVPYLHTPISALSGVGAARKAAYERMGVCTVEDIRLYSYRRDGRTGGMAAYLRLLEM